jgi:hypothetical protein
MRPCRSGWGAATTTIYILDDDYAPRATPSSRRASRAPGAARPRQQERRDPPGKRKTSLVLTGDTVVRLGHTSLRVRAADFPVEPELVDRTMHGWEGALPGLVGLAADRAVRPVHRVAQRHPSLPPDPLPAGAGLRRGRGLIWGGVWAFANRLFGRHARLGRHLFIFGCGLAAISVYKVLSSLMAYAFSLEQATRYGSQVAIVLAAGMMFFHLSTVKPQHARRFAMTCLILGLLGSGLTMISNEQRTGRVTDELYMPLLLPPAMRVSPDHSVEQFIGDVASMKAKLDKERMRKVKDDADDD